MKFKELKNKVESLTKLKVTNKVIGDILGLNPSQITARKGDVRISEIKKLEEYFGIAILPFDKEEYINSLVNDYTTEKLNEIKSRQDDIIADYFYNAFGSCGGGAFVLSEDKEKIKVPKVVIEYFSPCKKYSVINAIGDSMMPYICDKDKLIVEHCKPFEQIKDNKVYVFCYNNEIFVKRLVKNIDEIIVKSDNPDPIYRVRYIEKEDMNNIFLIGQIVGLMRNTR